MLTVTLPCMAGATLTFNYGGMSGGRRIISGSILDQPGTVARCAFISLWVEVREDRPGSGEWWISATRRVGTEWRAPLTEAGMRTLREQLAPLIHRHGFVTAWAEARAGADGLQYSGGDGAKVAAELRRLAAWWDQVAELAGILQDDPAAVLYEPVPADPRTGSRPQHLAPDRQHRCSWVAVAGRLTLGGELIGWVSDEGHLLPAEPLAR